MQGDNEENDMSDKKVVVKIKDKPPIGTLVLYKCSGWIHKPQGSYFDARYYSNYKEAKRYSTKRKCTIEKIFVSVASINVDAWFRHREMMNQMVEDFTTVSQ